MHPVGERELLSCDWGTSHFRLRYLQASAIRWQMQDENGCKPLHQRATEIRTATLEDARKEIFETQLRGALERFRRETGDPPKGIPLIVSGMASSTIGWKELPYARTPIPLDGSGLEIEEVTWNKPDWAGPTWLISGVATETNMMRGEEVEAIGLLSTLEKAPAELVLILPGTHSKHLYLAGGVLGEVRTYMTGELFAVLARHSILAASVDMAGKFDESGFADGIETARRDGLGGGLFRTRARQVLEKKTAVENAAFLSGLLIGSELDDVAEGSREIFLGGTGKLRTLYEEALKHLGARHWRAFSEEDCDTAVSRGHEIILSRLKS